MLSPYERLLRGGCGWEGEWEGEWEGVPCAQGPPSPSSPLFPPPLPLTLPLPAVQHGWVFVIPEL